MSWVTIFCSMIAAASLTLGVVHVMVWLQNRERTERLWYFAMTWGTAWMAYGELGAMMAHTTADYATMLRWHHVPILLNMIAIAGFILTHLRAGRVWLAVLALSLRAVTLVMNFSVPPNLNFHEMTGLKTIRFLGEDVSLAEGVRNPWMLVAQLALFLLLVFVIDAAWQVWRRGERRRAILTGGSIVLFILAATLQAVLSLWGVVDLPWGGSQYFLGLLILTAYDLTLETKRAVKLEVELKDTRESRHKEVTHLGRVAAFGEISVSLAHEMNQPLGIILSNAQAAQRILAKEKPDLEEVREILSDIVDEDLRASESIQSIRALLKRGEVERRPLDLNEVAGEVFHLMKNELTRRGMVLEKNLAAKLPLVAADRIQVQQVLLNLILNACEAMDGNATGNRQIRVSTSTDGSVVGIAVTDAGHGLPHDAEAIFQPFHTTKDQGLGMGLAICRSIVAAHHGQLWAENNQQGGATFHVVLPIREGFA